MIAGRTISVLSWGMILLLISCGKNEPRIFNLILSDRTGIQFTNTIREDDEHNVYRYMNIYTGAGVAAGDINNDGLSDLYFSGNMVTGRLYLNRGDLKFDDITEPSGVENTRWGTGTSMVDINQDGWLDIYVCVSGSGALKERANLLYINNGDNTFTESAEKYGIADTRQTMHATFFDYDKDGDLDLFLIINPAAYEQNVNVVRPRKVDGEALSTDVLYRNDGNKIFTDISREAGILVEGYSLGVAISDINDDDWPDIYISNDFVGNDILYINNQDGTFTDRLDDFVKHTSYAGMGNDVADINNDGLVDIMVLDMRPEDNKRQKLIISSTGYDRFQLMLQSGYEPQYSRNTLQLNNPAGKFSEVGYLSGVSSTDWSWSALLADYDNDTDRDLFVTNGFLRDLGNLDYIHYQSIYNTAMGTQEAKIKNKLDAIKSLEGAPLRDYVFENNGDATFTDRSEKWGIQRPGYSNGATYSDLDNDGDLELVVNNINEPTHVYENRANELTNRNFIRIKLLGAPPNRDGIGAKLRLACKGNMQYYEHFLSRGYESAVDPVIHFGLGSLSAVDSLEIQWPDGKYQLLRNIKANQLLTLRQEDAVFRNTTSNPDNPDPIFSKVEKLPGVNYLHRENNFVDFKIQPILPHMHSRGGPGVAVGDVNSDGLEDFFVGAAAGYSGQFFLQNPDGSFQQRALQEDSASEDMGVLLFDVDNDRDLDLYVVSGGSAFAKGSELYQDRLYINDGSGDYQKKPGSLPEIQASGSSVTAADFDRDGDLDIFVGGRIVPGEYPLPARSYLLRNDTKSSGQSGVAEVSFADVTDALAPDLSEIGLVTSALWTDYNNDGWMDLLVAGEFMPLKFYANRQGSFADETASTGLSYTSGWWNSLVAGDFDRDGDTDYMAGNLGLNTKYHASPEEPLCVYANDYDKNGRIDPVMCYYIQGENYLAHTRDDIIAQINAMRARFKTYEAYSEATFEESFLSSELESAYVVKTERFESSYIENLGGGKFSIKPLPLEAQISPIFGMLPGDFDEDNNLDAILVGNSYATAVSTGRYDASLGLYLRGDGHGNFKPVGIHESGLLADKDAKGLARCTLGNGRVLILVTNNSDSLTVFEKKSVIGDPLPSFDDAFAIVTFDDGTSYKKEFYYGSTYLSQSDRVLKLTPEVRSVVITDFKGRSREVLRSDPSVSVNKNR